MTKVEIKIIPQSNQAKFDVMLQSELVAQNVSAPLAVQAATGMLKVFESQKYRITQTENYPSGGRYWLLIKTD
jgi:hypothetical protein